jgi:hypothetical protein
MRQFLMILVACLAAGLIGCSTLRVDCQYDPQTDFSSMKTFGWHPVPPAGSVNELVVKQVRGEAMQLLEGKGLKSGQDNPDFLIAIHGGKVSKLDIVDWGYSNGGSGRYGRYGPYSTSRRIDVQEYEEGTLILDFVDTDTKELIWRGTATDALDANATPEDRRKQIRKAVTTILAKYPPPR